MHPERHPRSKKEKNKNQRELEKQVILACGAGGDPWRRDSLSLSPLCGTTRPSLVRTDNIYPRQGFFCVSSVHTHARDLLEWNRIIRDGVIRASQEMILNMEENNEPPFYFISSLFYSVSMLWPGSLQRYDTSLNMICSVVLNSRRERRALWLPATLFWRRSQVRMLAQKRMRI